jgi:3-dehydroquinate synthase
MNKNIQYFIKQEKNLFDVNNHSLLLGRNTKSQNCVLIVDRIVYKLYKNQINSYFSFHVESHSIILVDANDENKSLDQFVYIFNELNKYSINRRNEPVIIIGGGVTTDIGAFVTSCFRRGIPHIKVPTTVMGYVDASVGIKTGINFSMNKNRMGTFEPPLAVLLDKNFFYTLSQRDVVNGVAEIIKIAVIKNIKLFNLLEGYSNKLQESFFQCKVADTVLEISIQDMIDELAPNLYEDNLKRVADFGHTFSLIFEMEEKVEIKHGEAVAMDILFSSYLSYKRGLSSIHDFKRIYNLIESFSLPIYYNFFCANKLWKSLMERTLHRDGNQYFPVPCGIGKHVFLNDVTPKELKKLCNEIYSLEEDILSVEIS